VRPNVASQEKAGFTLIEMVISGALMTIILASAYVCLSAGISSQKLIDSRSDAVQGARVALSLMAADLRSAVPLSKEFEFIGMRRVLEGEDADNLDIATRNYVPRKAYEGDWCEVSYFVEKDPATKTLTLFRRRDATRDPEPLSGGTREEIARGLLGLRFEYYDGYDWYDEWGDPEGKKKTSAFPEPNVSGLPEAVRVTLTFDPSFERRRTDEADEETGKSSLTFQTTARLNMSLYFYRLTGGSATNSVTQSEASPNAQPGGPQ
jgi:type II secretion system protein J